MEFAANAKYSQKRAAQREERDRLPVMAEGAQAQIQGGLEEQRREEDGKERMRLKMRLRSRCSTPIRSPVMTNSSAYGTRMRRASIATMDAASRSQTNGVISIPA